VVLVRVRIGVLTMDWLNSFLTVFFPNFQKEGKGVLTVEWDCIDGFDPDLNLLSWSNRIFFAVSAQEADIHLKNQPKNIPNYFKELDIIE